MKTKILNIKTNLHGWEINITIEKCFSYLWYTYLFYEMFVTAEIGSLISNFSTHPRKKTSRLATDALSFQTSLCHCFLGFVDPRNCWPSSTIPSSWQETHHFLQSYSGHLSNISTSMSPYHTKQNFPKILLFSNYMVLRFFFSWHYGSSPKKQF
jgi:hypothetical protein